MSTAFVIDHGAGNLLSLTRALLKAGYEDVKRISTPDDVQNAENLILPGVGSFHRGMTSMEAMDLRGAIVEKANQGTPLLGICLGMQMLSNQSSEHGLKDGLGLVSGQVQPIRDRHSNADVPVPVIGWMNTHFLDVDSPYRYEGWYYYVHSYEFNVADRSELTAEYVYRNERITACVSRENIVGVQFHPEKSGKAGIGFLRKYREEMTKRLK